MLLMLGNSASWVLHIKLSHIRTTVGEMSHQDPIGEAIVRIFTHCYFFFFILDSMNAGSTPIINSNNDVSRLSHQEELCRRKIVCRFGEPNNEQLRELRCAKNSALGKDSA